MASQQPTQTEHRFILTDEQLIGLRLAASYLSYCATMDLPAYDDALGGLARLAQRPTASNQELRAAFMAELFANVGRALYAMPPSVLEALSETLRDFASYGPEREVLDEDYARVKKEFYASIKAADTAAEGDANWSVDCVADNARHYDNRDESAIVDEMYAAEAAYEARQRVKRAEREAKHTIRGDIAAHSNT